jgi:hypothetical protein
MQQDWEPVIIRSKAAVKAATKPQIQGKPKQLVDLEIANFNLRSTTTKVFVTEFVQPLSFEIESVTLFVPALLYLVFRFLVTEL